MIATVLDIIIFSQQIEVNTYLLNLKYFCKKFNIMDDANTKLTPLSELGEFGLIDRLTSDIKTNNNSTLLGIGDDAAVIKPEKNMLTLVSKDLLLEGVHFDMMYTPLKHLGYKTAVVNFSDIAAMNGKPKQLLVGIGVGAKFSVEAIEEIYVGIKKACEVYGVDFIGGDTTSSASGLVISATISFVFSSAVLRNSSPRWATLSGWYFFIFSR